MPTTGIINGHNLRIFTGGTTVAKSLNCSVSMTRETRSTSHKDIGTGVGAGWSGKEYGEASWEMSGDALYAEGETFESLWSAFNNKTKISVEFSTDVEGDKKFTGTAVITSLEMTAPNNEDVTYSFSLEGDGALTRETVTV